MSNEGPSLGRLTFFALLGFVVGFLFRARLFFGLFWLVAWLVVMNLSTASPSGRGAQGMNSVVTTRWLFGVALLVWLILRVRRLVRKSREIDGSAALAWDGLARGAASGVSRLRRRGEK